MKLKKIFYWASDYSLNTGEGRLANLFLKKFKKNDHYNYKRILLPKNKILRHKYINIFIGILYSWFYFLKKEKFIYINYLPLWNSLIFLLLSPNTILGPITGGAKFSKKSEDYLIRKYLFPILYYLSSIILRFRYNQKFIFSTDLLQNYLPKDIIKKSQFNFIFEAIKITKNNKKFKEYDFIFYYRKHKNKSNTFPIEFVKKLLSFNYKIYVVGDKIDLKGINNCGYISHYRVLKLLKKSKYSIISSENIYSFFTIDCINNNVKLLVDFDIYKSIKYFKKKFIKFNFKKNKLNNLNYKKCQ